MANIRTVHGIAHFGNFVKALRRKHGLSQRELASSVGVNLRTIQRIEEHGSERLSTIRSIGHRLSVEFETVALERINKPLVVMITNPCASTGSSTLCVCLAGYYAAQNKRVLLLHAKQNEDWASWLEARPADKPRIDACLLQDPTLLMEVSRDCAEYDVIIVDVVRLGYYGEMTRKALKSICERSDVILVPFRYAYPSLVELPEELRGGDYVSLKEELRGYAQMQKEANLLLLMYQVGVPDEGYEEGENEEAHIEYAIKMNRDFRERLVDYSAEIDLDGVRVCESMIGMRNAYEEICHMHTDSPFRYTGDDGNSRATFWTVNGQTPSDMPLTRSQQAVLRELKELTDEIAQYTFQLDNRSSDSDKRRESLESGR
jgi:transcriptional regulator with XRE-family HTH domain